MSKYLSTQSEIYDFLAVLPLSMQHFESQDCVIYIVNIAMQMQVLMLTHPKN